MVVVRSCSLWQSGPMGGAVFIGGGCSAADEERLWNELFAVGGRVVCWPYALRKRDAQASVHDWLTGELAKRGDLDVDTWIDVPDRAIAGLSSAQILFIPGGNTFALLDCLRARGWLGRVGEFVEGGGLLYGGSAGAILCGADIAVAGLFDEDVVGISDTRALDLLAGAVVYPHFTAADAPVVEQWAGTHDEPVLAVPERGGLIFRDGVFRETGPERVGVFPSGAIELTAAVC
ncbi:Type 1 glutamine amidotransferase-like domain-containing protein [Micromonospora rifamycinica]|uniref:Type 1 glutamine amidotransferase-like domain-containing protein n=1 Tax=Micromonospora rifamycinica TaxID=291594 RepID=UPI0033FDCD7C